MFYAYSALSMVLYMCFHCWKMLFIQLKNAQFSKKQLWKNASIDHFAEVPAIQSEVLIQQLKTQTIFTISISKLTVTAYEYS